ncbi:MAG: GldG family protein [Myxococcota bacterium]
MSIGDDTVNVTEVSEPALTNAIVKLTRTGEKVVYFIEGHGERAVDGENGDARTGFGLAADALRNENYRVEKLLLAATGEVPDDADVVVLAGPRRGLLDVEYAALERYLARGGAVLAMVDPRVRGLLVDRLASWGATLGDDVVIDRTLAMFGRAMSPFAASYDSTHEITADLREPSLFHEVRSVEGDAGFSDLVSTSDSSWGETDLLLLDTEQKVSPDPGDRLGPVVVAVAGRPTIEVLNGDADGDAGEEEAPADPRLAVYGDADFASNEYITAYRNRDLFVNTVNWLIGDVEAISVRPNQSRASRFQLSNEQFSNIRQLSLFVLPEAIAVLGVFTWWSRRNPTG